MKSLVVFIFAITFFTVAYMEMPTIAISQTMGQTNVSQSMTSTPYKPINLTSMDASNNIINLRTTQGNVSNLEFTTSFTYQHITWFENSGNKSVIYVASSRDGGKTFDNPINLSRINGDASDKRFVVDQERMYGVYVQHNPNNDDEIKFIVTNDGGMHWDTLSLIDTKEIVNDLAINLQGDKVTVAWSTNADIDSVNQYLINR